MPYYSPTKHKGTFIQTPGAAQFVLANHKTMSLKALSNATMVAYHTVATFLEKRGLRACSEARLTRRINLQPLQQLKATEWAYLAALVDGEGTITIQSHVQRGRRYFQIKVVVTNTSYKLYVYLKSLGFLAVVATNNLGRRYWLLNITGYQTDVLLRGMLPYLIIKREHAQLVLHFIAMRRRQRHRAVPTALMLKSWQRIRAINQRGFRFERELAEHTSTTSSPSIIAITRTVC